MQSTGVQKGAHYKATWDGIIFDCTAKPRDLSFWIRKTKRTMPGAYAPYAPPAETVG